MEENQLVTQENTALIDKDGNVNLEFCIIDGLNAGYVDVWESAILIK